MKNVYFVIRRKDSIDDKEGYINYVLKVNDSHNYAKVFRDDRISIIHYAPTRKRALEIADSWNEAELQNGCYLFDKVYPAFVEGVL